MNGNENDHKDLQVKPVHYDTYLMCKQCGWAWQECIPKGITVVEYLKDSDIPCNNCECLDVRIIPFNKGEVHLNGE